MSTAARWTVGVAGLLYAASGFIPFTTAAHAWAAIGIGAVAGVLGFMAARKTPWQGALITLAGLWIVVSSLVGLLQTGPGHLWGNLLVGLATLGVVSFIREGTATRA
jgi:hypothetical protein